MFASDVDEPNLKFVDDTVGETSVLWGTEFATEVGSLVITGGKEFDKEPCICGTDSGGGIMRGKSGVAEMLIRSMLTDGSPEDNPEDCVIGIGIGN